MYSGRSVRANSVDPDQMLQNGASDQGLHYSLTAIQVLDTSVGGKMDLFKL